MCLAALAALESHPALAGVGIRDDLGREVTLGAPARRVVALYGAFNEILAGMGLTGIIAARTKDDLTPPEIAHLPAIGTHLRPNDELLAALGPDLVLQMGHRSESERTTTALTRLNIPVAVFDVRDFAGLFSCIERLGVLTGHTDAARALIARMNATMDQAVKSPRPARPRVFFEVRESSLLGAGKGSFVSGVIARAGGENALATPEKFARLSEEAVIAADPDVYLVQRGPMNPAPSNPADRPRLKGLRCVANGNVFFVDEKTYSRPSPQSAQAVSELSAILDQIK